MRSSQPNDLLRRARQANPSPSRPGRGMSRQELADAVNAYLYEKTEREYNLDDNYVGKLERGEHRWPNDLYREGFRSVLRSRADRDLGFYIVRGDASQAPLPEPSPDQDLRLPRNDFPLPTDRVDLPSHGRRAVLAGISALAVEFGLRGGAATRRGELGAGDVERLDALTSLYRSIDYEYGGGLLYAEVSRFAESMSDLIDSPSTEPTKRRLLSAIAAARQLAGWTAFDSGRHSDAQRHWLSAERAAVAAEELRLAARVRYSQARQFQHLHHNRDALESLHLARAQLDGHATPAITAMLHGSEAASLAALGDEKAALRSLQSAADSHETIVVDAEPEWMRFYDHGEILAQYGRVYRDLARRDARRGPEAVQWVTAAVRGFGAQNVRSEVLNEVGLCSALFLAHEPDEAVSAGLRAIARADQLSSRRIHDRIANLGRDLVRCRRTPEVEQFSRTVTLMRQESPTR